MFCSRAVGAFGVAILLGLAGCRKAPPAPVNQRVAIQLIENQSADPELKGAGAAVTLALAQMVNGKSPELAPVVVRDTEGVRESGAGRWVRGTLRRRGTGGVQLLAEVVDTATTQVLVETDTTSADGKGLVLAAAGLAERVVGAPVKPAGEEPEAWLEYGKLATAPSPAGYEAFLQKHPQFGAAVVGYAEYLSATGDRERLRQLAAARAAGLPKEGQAELALLVSETPEERMRAWQTIGLLRRSDPRPYAEMGRIAAAAKLWPAAQTAFEKLTELEPKNVDWFNQLGYALAQQGKADAAVAAIREYQKLAPQDPNGLDSLGEVQYMNGRWEAAGRAFEECATKYPQFQGGLAARKAAFAWGRAGKYPNADLLFERWLSSALALAPPSLATFERAMYLAQTNRWEQAQGAMAKEIAGSDGGRKDAGEIYLALMELGHDGKRPAAAFLAAKARAAVEPGVRNELALLGLFAQPPASIEVWKKRIEAVTNGPGMEGLRGRLLEVAALYVPGAGAPVGKTVPLPENLDSGLTALELRTRNAVIR